MITDGLLMIGVVAGVAGLLIVLEKTTGWKFFKYVPAMVLMYLTITLLNTLGVFGEADNEARDALKELRVFLLPAMVFLFLLQCDIKKIIQLGPKLLITFFVTAVSIFAAFILSFLIFQPLLPEGSDKALGALLGSWTGGSANMAAVQGMVGVPESAFGIALITDTVMYSVWLMLMFSAVVFSGAFNRFTKADTAYLDRHIQNAQVEKGAINLTNLAGLTFGSLLVSAVALRLGSWLEEAIPSIADAVNATSWTIIIVSVLGLIIAQTRLGKIAGSHEVGTLMLFMVIGQLASGSDFAAIAEGGWFLLAGAVVLLIHAVLMLIYAKLTKTDLFSVVVASVANVGGMASAPVVAGTFSRHLVPVGVLFALLGSILGTWIGYGGAQVMMGL
ncbi:DUF819 domain-containing protein [Micrococcus lylae]|uniref:DUF819 domain-containing protein n=1 Tax=Micrococcus lylae TaxID=1273 RepID=A0A1R4JMT0_9MICC|nr:DUF819 family protein [Micrococcus lylae]TFH98676.1 DUF819 domain-containing protein [Micrococcus lylae]SJN33103.1 DUF819 domain-containing protein [Micrococcus lylae]